jgi:predicted nucleic acid-binding protein
MDKILVDSSVIIDIFEDTPDWADWSTDALIKYSRDYSMIINDIIYSELSLAFNKVSELDNAIEEAGLKMEKIPREALMAAGKAFLLYRKNKGLKTNTLPDFFIGAHAQELKIPLLTRDTRRIKTYFPGIKIISPEAR